MRACGVFTSKFPHCRTFKHALPHFLCNPSPAFRDAEQANAAVITTSQLSAQLRMGGCDVWERRQKHVFGECGACKPYCGPHMPYRPHQTPIQIGPIGYTSKLFRMLRTLPHAHRRQGQKSTALSGAPYLPPMRGADTKKAPEGALAYLAPRSGFEPLTYGVEDRCSIHLS